MHTHGTSPCSVIETIEHLPRRIREIATLRGLGYSYRAIAAEFGVSPQAISLMLSRHRRGLRCLKGAVELQTLSARAVNTLGRHGIRTREEAIRMNLLDLVGGERNCGAKTRAELERWMHAADARHSLTNSTSGEVGRFAAVRLGPDTGLRAPETVGNSC